MRLRLWAAVAALVAVVVSLTCGNGMVAACVIAGYALWIWLRTLLEHWLRDRRWTAVEHNVMGEDADA